MARPRNLSDAQLLDRIAETLGTADNTWTLAEAAAGADVHPATLIKRFGSRHGLLVALSHRWIEAIPTEPLTADGRRELMAWIDALGDDSTSHAQVLTRLDMLLEDLRDPELRALLDLGWDRTITYLSALIVHARHERRLAGDIGAEQVARLILDTAHGGLLRSAVATPGSADPAQSTRTLLEALT